MSLKSKTFYFDTETYNAKHSFLKQSDSVITPSYCDRKYVGLNGVDTIGIEQIYITGIKMIQESDKP